MVVGNMQIKLGEVWTCNSWDEHANRQTHVMCIQTWLTGTPHSPQYSASILGQTNNHSNILSYCMISTVISSNLINNYSFKLQFNHIIFYHLQSFLQRAQCSHCKRCISYSNSVRQSVCLSVCPSHADIMSKRRHVARCSLHCRIAKCV